jgi:CheY-like chemotaxis protein
MVVEDHADVRTLICDVLRANGYSVIACEDGADALEKLTPPLPALILLDLSMPIIDGFEFRRRQLASDGLRHIPVVIVSADARIEDRRVELQAVAYLQQPVRIRTLLAVVAEALAPAR